MIGKEAYVELKVDGRPVCRLAVSGDLTGAEALDLIGDVLRDGEFPVIAVAGQTPALTIEATGMAVVAQTKLQIQDLRDGDALALSGYAWTR